MSEERKLTLTAMAAPAGALPPWETEWTAFGPIPNAGDSHTWPGEVGFAPLELDGASEIPARATIAGVEYVAQVLTSIGGRFDLTAALDPKAGLPIAYLMTTVEAAEPGWLPISFGANWGTQWWVNGAAVYNSIAGNGGDPAEAQTQQFYAPLRAGTNVIVVKIVAGTRLGWTLVLRCLPPVADLPPGGPLPACPPTCRDRSRDYVRAGLRIEHRPSPVPVAEACKRERILADHGVEAHWIGIVDHTGSPYADAEALPPGDHYAPGNAELFRAQVAEMHANGMSAMTWFPGVHCRSAAAAHPDWRSVPVGRERPDTFTTEADWNLCHNSPYGEALIAFVLESLARYDLDGFWFDGTSRSAHYLGCVCQHCTRRFRAAAGMDVPQAVDWDDAAFRCWLAWRYEDYMAFWGRLAATVHRQFPNARIAVNHLHRLRHDYTTGLPLRRYHADVVAGTESQDSPFVGAFHARLQGAYGQRDTEVWMGLHKSLDRGENWPPPSYPEYRYLHHAMAVLTAGGMPSFGTPFDAECHTALYDHLSRLINPRQELVNGRAEPYAAVLLSQQAETFHFSRRPPPAFPDDYWDTVVGWHHLLMQERLPLSLIFDDALNATELGAFPVVVLPLAVGLTNAQVAALLDYVRHGGLLVTDRFLGGADKWGEPADPRRVAPLLGAPAAPPPAPTADLADTAPHATLRAVGAGHVLVTAGNVGLHFARHPAAVLATEVADLLRGIVAPRVQVEGPAGIHVGVYRERGRLLVHVHNFIPWSGAECFPNPVLTAPPRVEGVRVHIRHPAIRTVRQRVPEAADLDVTHAGDGLLVSLPPITWGVVLECRF